MLRKSVKLELVAVVLFVTLGMGCMKNHDNTPQEPQTILSILHAAPDAGDQYLFLNGESIVNQALPYTTSAPLQIKPSRYQIAFSPNEDGGSAVSQTDSLGVNAFNSVVLYEEGSTSKIMFIPDAFEETQDANVAYLRFLQLSSDQSDPVEIYLDEERVETGRTFADNESNHGLDKFKTVSSGIFSFAALNEGGDTLGIIRDQKLSAGSAYTLFLANKVDETSSDESAEEGKEKPYFVLRQTY